MTKTQPTHKEAPPTEQATEGERTTGGPMRPLPGTTFAAPAVAQGETPRTNRLRDSVLDAFSRFHKGQIYLEDFAEFVRLAFNDAAHIESELNAAEHSNMNHREYIHRLEADRATLRQSLAAVKKERDEARDCGQRVDDKLATAESELAELRKDRERIEWLGAALKNENDLDIVMREGGYYVAPIFDQEKTVENQPSLRAAIDAARNQQEKAQ